MSDTGLPINRNNSFSTSREQLIPQNSANHHNNQTCCSPNLLSPVTGGGPSVSAVNLVKESTTHYVRYSLPSDANSSANSDVSSIGRYSSPTKFFRIRSDLKNELAAVRRLDDNLNDSAGVACDVKEVNNLASNHGKHVDESNANNYITYEDEYTKENLFTLPPLFMAVALKNAQIVRDLIKHGANVNFADKHLVTPLHISLCQERLSRTCVQLLVANGAKIYAQNVLGVSPADLLMSKSYQLKELQKLLAERAFSAFQSVNMHHQPLQATSSSGGIELNRRPTHHAYSISSSTGIHSIAPATPANPKTPPFRAEISSSGGGGGGGENSVPLTDPSSSISDTRQVLSDEALAEDKELDLLHLCGSLASVNQPPTSAATSGKTNNFLKKLKPSSKVKKCKKNAKLASTNSNGLDVHLCLEDISSDGPSNSSYQARESAFETSSTKGDTDAGDAGNYEDAEMMVSWIRLIVMICSQY